MTAQDLKNSILQLAVQGKLVPHDPSDEPVDLKGLRLKNTDECEFDIPDSWRLAHLESISTGVPSKQYQILESEVKQHGKYSVISQSKAYSSMRVTLTGRAMLSRLSQFQNASYPMLVTPCGMVMLLSP
jgi:type I restriction enzyme S subunit